MTKREYIALDCEFEKFVQYFRQTFGTSHECIAVQDWISHVRLCLLHLWEESPK